MTHHHLCQKDYKRVIFIHTARGGSILKQPQHAPSVRSLFDHVHGWDLIAKTVRDGFVDF